MGFEGFDRRATVPLFEPRLVVRARALGWTSAPSAFAMEEGLAAEALTSPPSLKAVFSDVSCPHQSSATPNSTFSFSAAAASPAASPSNAFVVHPAEVSPAADSVSASPPLSEEAISASPPFSEEAKPTLGQMVAMTAKVKSDTAPDEWEEAVRYFRRLLSIVNNPPIDKVIESGIVPRLVQFLSEHSRPVLQFEAAWSLTNICSGNAVHTKTVMDAGAVPLFVGLMDSTDDNVREQVIWALGNIAGDGATSRDFVLGFDAIAGLLQLAAKLTDKSPVTTVRNIAWTTSNLCRGKPAPAFSVVSPSLGLLERLVYAADEEVVTDACWALSYLSDGPNSNIDAVLEIGVAPRLVQLLGSTSTAQSPALRCVGNILTGDEAQTSAIVSIPQAVPLLCGLLNHPKKNVKKETMWALSNIAAGSKAQIEALVNAGVFTKISNLLGTPSPDVEITKEAVWCLSNPTGSGTESQIVHLVESGGLRALCTQLSSTSCAKISKLALEAIDNILQRCSLPSAALVVRQSPAADSLARLRADGGQPIEIRLRVQSIWAKCFPPDTAAAE